MRRFTINLRSCIKRVTRRDDSQSSDVWSREETRSLSSDAQQDEEYKASKGHTRTRRADLISALCECAHNILRGNVRLTPPEKVAPEEIQGQIASDSEQEIVHI